MAQGARRLAVAPARVRGGWRGGWRGGFTLIEVMLALALVVALAVVSWASLSPLRNQVAMEEASAAVATGIDQARTLAATSNRVLEVRARITATALEIQARGLGGDGDEQETGAGEAGADEVGAGALGADEERPWKTLMRIVGSFAREDPFEDAGGGGDAGGGRDARGGGDAGGGGDSDDEYVLIGVALPDGSMVAAVPLRLKDSQGRWSVVRVGTWTTRVEVEVGVEVEVEAEAEVGAEMTTTELDDEGATQEGQGG